MLRPVIGAIVIAASACNGAAGWGPMAVVNADTSVVIQVLGGGGPIVIGSKCIFLRRNDGSAVTLVWRAGEVQWTGSSILFSNVEVPRKLPITVRDGMLISVAGEPTEVPVWVTPPHPECPIERFTVHEVIVGVVTD